MPSIAGEELLMSMRSILNEWRELSLREKIEVAKTILMEIGAVRSERASEVQAELRSLGGPHEHYHSKGAPEGSTSRYRSLSDASRTWAGIGEVPHWLQEEMDAGETPLADFKVR